jgi:SWI/SNF-related matrix-associated actin-dependent regulator 1 of chromatin subfamily A
MQLIYEKPTGRFILESGFHDRHIPKAARFRWDPAAKKWWTDDPAKAGKLSDYATDEARAMFQKEKEKFDRALEQSRAASADIELPKPVGLEYMPFQKAGIAYGLDHENVLFGDEMGLGKTIQALGMINADDSINKVLIICPASLKLNWRNEAKKWLIKDYGISVIVSKDGWKDAHIVIINYDILKKFSKQIHAFEWDMLIVDESHYLKNNKSIRTKEVMGAWHKDPAKRKDELDRQSGEPNPSQERI